MKKVNGIQTNQGKTTKLKILTVSVVFKNKPCNINVKFVKCRLVCELPNRKPNCHFIILFLQTANIPSVSFYLTAIRLLERCRNTFSGFRFKWETVKNSIFQLNIFVFCNFFSFIFLSHCSALNSGTCCLNVADVLLTWGQCFFLLGAAAATLKKKVCQHRSKTPVASPQCSLIASVS